MTALNERGAFDTDIVPSECLQVRNRNPKCEFRLWFLQRILIDQIISGYRAHILEMCVSYYVHHL